MMEGDLIFDFIASLKEYKFVLPNFKTLFYNIDDLDIFEIGEDATEIYYFDTFNRDVENNEVQQKYETNILKLFTFYPRMTGIMSIAIDQITAFIQGRELMETRNPSELLEVYRQNTFNLARGETKFNSGNSAYSNIYIKQVDSFENGSPVIKIVYSNEKMINPQPYGCVYHDSIIRRCDWRENVREIISYETKKVLLIASFSGDYKHLEESIIQGTFAAVRNIYDGDPINNHYITIKYFDYKSDLDYLEKNLPEYLKDEDIKLIVGCSTYKGRRIISNYLNTLNNPPTYIYPRIVVGQECDRNAFFTGLLPEQYINRFLEYFITTSYTKELYLVLDKDYESGDFEELVEDASSGLFTFIRCYHINDNNPVTKNLINNITAEMSNGGVIMTILTSTHLKTFLKQYTNLRLSSSKYPVIDILCEEEDMDLIDDDYKKNIYKLSRYYSDIPTNDNIEFKKIIKHYTTIENPTSVLEGVYGGILIWKEAAKEVGSFDLKDIRDMLYTKSVNVGSGEMRFDASNFAINPFFVSQYSSDGSTKSTVYFKYESEIPSPYSWNVERTYGYKCSFHSNLNNDKYKVPVKRVLLTAPLTGYVSNEFVGVVDSFQIAINEINNNNGVGGYTIKGDIIDTQSSVDKCFILLEEYVNKNPIVIFGAVAIACQESLLSSGILEDKKILLFQLDELKQDFCDENVAVAVDHATQFRTIINIIHTRFYDNVYILSPKDIEQAEYVYDSLNDLKVTVHKYEEDEWSENEINNLLVGNGCICFFGRKEEFIVLMNTLKSLNDYSQYNVIVMRNHEMIRELTEYYDMEYELFSFYEFDLDIEENTKFKESIYKRLSEDTYISDAMSRTYSSVNLWALSVNSLELDTKEEGYDVSSLDITSVKEKLRSTSFTGPSGLCNFGNNQYLKRKSYLSKMQSDGKAILEWSSSEPKAAEAWKFNNNNYVKCDFSDSNVDKKKEITTYYVAIMLSMTGDYRKSEGILFHSVSLALDNINAEGGLLDNYIWYKLYDTESNDDKYIELMKEILNSQSIDIVFGGYFPETLEKIGNIFDNSQKMMFYLGRSFGDACYSNVIIPSVHPRGGARSFVRKLLEKTSSIFIIYSSNRYSTLLLDIITELMKTYQITSNGASNIDDGEKSVRDIKTSLPSSGYIINIIFDEANNLKFFKYLENYDIKSPNYYILSYFLSETIIHKVNIDYIAGHDMSGTYFESLASESLNSISVPYMSSSFNNRMHDRLGNQYITGTHEAAYISILLWKSIVTKSNSFNKEYFTNMYNYPIDVPSSKTEIDPSNFLGRIVYIATIQNDYSLYVNWGPTSLFYPEIYPQNNITNVGYTCDWRDSSKGNYSFTDPIIIAFLHEKDIGGMTERHNCFIQDITIDEINSKGGILGRTVAAVHFWVVINDAYKTTREIIEYNKATLIAGCLTPDCGVEVSRYLQNLDQIYLFTGRDDGYSCSKNTISVGLGMKQKLDPLFKYLDNIGIESLFVVGSTRNSSQTEYYLIKEFGDKNNYPIIGSSFFTPYNNDLLLNCISNVTSLLETNSRVASIL